MSSTTFTYDLEDAHFVLFDQLRAPERLAKIARFADFDRDVLAATVEEGEKVAREILAPINAKGDKVGCVVDEDGNVTTPPGYKAAWKAVADGGWIAPTADPEVGGAGMPSCIGVVLQEMFSGACMAFTMYPGLSAAAARVLQHYAPKAWREPVARKMFSGEWGGTMCLTESGAGSSVGDNRCKATRTDEPDVYLLEGEKIFITGGDSDMVSNICHLVLARTADAPPGTKGLSLFLVPKFIFGDDMKLGERNGAHVLRLEHKMGINGSATCVLGLGVRGPCKGWLVGEERQGIEIMFHMMNEARIGVGVQGIAAGSAAFQFARHYAVERVQGTLLSQMKDANAPRVPIARHPDVRRMLLQQKSLVEALRSLALRMSLDMDDHLFADDEKVREIAGNRVDLLVPILKSLGTDIGFDVAVSAVQVFGGYGFTQEYPVEQLVRDSKIQSIYEGTNGIQALDLLGRKMRVGGGKLFMGWMQDAGKRIETAKAAGFSSEADQINKAMQNVAAAAMHIAGVAQSKNIDAAMLWAVTFQRAMGMVVLALESMDQAVAARAVAAERGESAFLRGKTANLRFFVSHLLPHAVADAKAIQSGDTSPLDEALFAS